MQLGKVKTRTDWHTDKLANHEGRPWRGEYFLACGDFPVTNTSKDVGWLTVLNHGDKMERA